MSLGLIRLFVQNGLLHKRLWKTRTFCAKPLTHKSGSSLGTVYYVGTAGHVSAEMIRQYIESQEQRYAQ